MNAEKMVEHMQVQLDALYGHIVTQASGSLHYKLLDALESVDNVLALLRGVALALDADPAAHLKE